MEVIYETQIEINPCSEKERIILEKIAKAFEPGRIYTEREVNIIITDFHDDFCTIRRDMIGEKIMDKVTKIGFGSREKSLPFSHRMIQIFALPS